MLEQHCVEVVSRLVVTEHEKWDKDGATQDQGRQDSAGGAWYLQPDRGLPAAKVCEVKQEETGEGHEVRGGPPTATVCVDGLDPRGQSRKNHQGDAEDVEDAETQNPGLPEDGLQRWDRASTCSALTLHMCTGACGCQHVVSGNKKQVCFRKDCSKTPLITFGLSPDITVCIYLLYSLTV